MTKKNETYKLVDGKLIVRKYEGFCIVDLQGTTNGNGIYDFEISDGESVSVDIFNETLIDVLIEEGYEILQ